jgi:hypothetical protein
MIFHREKTLNLLKNTFNSRFANILKSLSKQSDIISFLTRNQLFTFGYQCFLYVACRLLNPSIVIETGVGAGLSTTFILQALEDNRKGELYSIELPKAKYTTEKGKEVNASHCIPKGLETGWLVLKELKGRWELIMGRSEDELPVLMKKLEHVDIFFHDSEHTYENMLREYRIVYPYMDKGDMLASDDVMWNDAFEDFSRSINHRPVIVNSEYGFIVK